MITLKNGRSLLINSKLSMDYKTKTKTHWQLGWVAFKNAVIGKPKPYAIELTFIRDSRRRFDFINASQIIFDLMQEYNWIDDDDSTNIVPHFNKQVTIDKLNAGVIIKVL